MTQSSSHSASGREAIGPSRSLEAHDEPLSLLKEGLRSSRVQSDSSAPPEQPTADQHFDINDDLRTVIAWLRGLPALDLDDVVADGGVTSGMVVQHESKLMADYVQRYLGTLPAPTGWRSIESAPKDGSYLVFGRWDDGSPWWNIGHTSGAVGLVYGDWDTSTEPTHWAPLTLPEAPR